MYCLYDIRSLVTGGTGWWLAHFCDTTFLCPHFRLHRFDHTSTVYSQYYSPYSTATPFALATQRMKLTQTTWNVHAQCEPQCQETKRNLYSNDSHWGVMQILGLELGVMQILVFLDTNMSVSPTQSSHIGGIAQCNGQMQVFWRRGGIYAYGSVLIWLKNCWVDVKPQQSTSASSKKDLMSYSTPWDPRNRLELPEYIYPM